MPLSRLSPARARPGPRRARGRGARGAASLATRERESRSRRVYIRTSRRVSRSRLWRLALYDTYNMTRRDAIDGGAAPAAPGPPRGYPYGYAHTAGPRWMDPRMHSPTRAHGHAALPASRYSSLVPSLP